MCPGALHPFDQTVGPNNHPNPFNVFRTMKTFSKVAAMAALAAVATSAQGQLSLGTDCGCPPLGSRTTVQMSTLTNAQGELTGDVTLTCNNTYSLNEQVYVQNGARLFIQPGTVIRGQSGTGLNSKYLLVMRGGQIFANGNASCPIIFTDNNDPLDGSYPVSTRGQWGGLIMLGRATNNLLATDGLGIANGLGVIEGTDVADPRNYYGADLANSETFNDNDNSGILRYVSIRHGGTNISGNNESNGLTLGSGGRGTTLEYIEVIANDDDGIEFFGGTVDLKYSTVAYCNDDYWDWDHGYSGRIQFGYGIQLPAPGSQGDNGMECDGDDSDSSNPPLSDPTVYNMTIIGRGAGDHALDLKERTRGSINNSIFANFARGAALDNSRATDAYQEWLAGNLEVNNNIFQNVTNIITVGGAAAGATDAATFAADGNTSATVIDATLAIDPNTNAVSDAVNPVPTSGVTTTALPPVDDFFTGANYKGAFAPGATSWMQGWTLAALQGADGSAVDCPTDINGDGTTDILDFLDLNSNFNQSCAN